MMTIGEVRGAIFDLDDTLLDNGPADKPAEWLHSRSRLAAVQEAAEQYSLPALRDVTPEENVAAFHTAPQHTLAAAIWNLMYMKGLVDKAEADPSHPLHATVGKIVDRKNELHESILREFGVELPGATDFVRKLAARGLSQHLALATAAIPRDITIFLDKYALHDLFPRDHIVSLEDVTRPKPDPQCFDLAFRRLGLPESARRQVLAFEDNPRGIASAKGAGLFVCAITSRLKRDDPALIAAGPDLIADSYAEFADLLGLNI